MSRQLNRLPHQIDPFRLSEAGAMLEGELPLGQMRRLNEFLANDEGQIKVSLRFDVDELGVPCVIGKLDVNLHLLCQRCLDEFSFPVSHEVALAWVHTEREIERLPTRYEPYLVETTPLQLNDIVEEELLLAIPQVPMHEPKDCKVKLTHHESTEPVQEKQPENPFSILSTLKPNLKK